MNKWLANHCRTPTITWTAWTACIARKVQAMRWDGMWKVKIWNIWRNWFWSKNHCNRNRSDGKHWIGLSRETGPVTNNQTLDQAAFLKITSFTIACGMWSWKLDKNTMRIWHVAVLKYQKDTFGHLTTEIWIAIWKNHSFHSCCILICVSQVKNIFPILFRIYHWIFSKNKHHPYQIQADIVNNNNYNYCNINGYQHEPISTTPTLPKLTKPILHAQLVGDDFFRVLVTRDSIQMFNRSKWNELNWIELATAFIEIKWRKTYLNMHFL